MVAAIIIADSESVGKSETRCQSNARSVNWACVDFLGQPVLGRIADGLKNAGIDSVSVFAPRQTCLTPGADGQALTFDTWKAAELRLARCKQEGVETVLIANCGAYGEFDVADMLACHREQETSVSRAIAADGTLDFWLVDPSRFAVDDDLQGELSAADTSYYEVHGYLNRLDSAHNYRRLVLDSFSSRCKLRPRGVESRPGVWMAENAVIGRGSRVVAPAFIGRDVKVGDDCLITRGSNVERSSHIDFATAVEDSSILQKTYVGIGLDLSHSIADGRNLWNLRHDVVLEITDPVVMRPNLDSKRERRPWQDLREDGIGLSAQGVAH